MGWEERNGRTYYYRKVRDGDTVRSEYVGCGMFAEAAAQIDKAERCKREIRRERDREERRAVKAEARRVDYAIRQVTRLTHAALLVHGFHTHKGQWRKKRE